MDFKFKLSVESKHELTPPLSNKKASHHCKAFLFLLFYNYKSQKKKKKKPANHSSLIFSPSPTLLPL